MDPVKVIDDRFTVLRNGIVATGTVSGTSGNKVVCTVQNQSLTLPRLSSYTPTVGDVVVILTAAPGAWLVLGKPA
jgi:hypothetical protein